MHGAVALSAPASALIARRARLGGRSVLLAFAGGGADFELTAAAAGCGAALALGDIPALSLAARVSQLPARLLSSV